MKNKAPEYNNLTVEREPISLIFQYSPEFEQNRIENTLKKADWFKENGYRVRLPGNLSLENTTQINGEEIGTLISEEYNPSVYELVKEKILEDWKNEERTLKNGLAKLNLQYDPEYEIILTRYGVGGSYDNNSRPKAIIVNFEASKQNSPIKIVCHEIIHLSIQDWIEKYKVSHWSKEHLVDLIMKEIFGDSKMQDVDPVKATQIDEIFENNKENIEEAVRRVGDIK